MNRFRHFFFALIFACTSGAWASEYVPTVAIENITIHDARQPAAIRGTILITDGKIADAGPDVKTPSDAVRFDGAGLHAYPAFIDARSHLGIAEDKRTEAQRKRVEDENPDASQGPLAKTRKANRRGIHPEYRVLDVYDPAREAIDAYHNQGFATALVAPRSGLLGGMSSVIDITTAPLRRVVLRADFAMHASFVPGEPGVYPRTVLGATATLRQFFSDLRWYRDFIRYIERHPKSGDRLPSDAALETAHSYLRSGGPIVFEANTEQEILRALDLAEELNVTIWISGAREGYKLVDRLKASQTRLIVSLAFDEEPEGEKKGDEKKEDERAAQRRRYEPERLRHERERLWLEKVNNLRTLADAGLKPAVSSSGTEGPAELMKNLRRAIEAGLPAEIALEALTVNAARLFDADNLLGTIEPKHLANIAIFTESFENEDAQAKWVFVEGQRFICDSEKAEEAEKDNEADSIGTNGSKAAASSEGAQNEPKPPVEQPDWRIETEADRKPRMHTGGDVLISGCTILPVVGPPIEKGNILVLDGKIAEIGQTVRKPPGIAVIEAEGLYVCPGFIDCHSHMALDAVNEGTLSITAEVRVADAIDHRQVAIYRALAGGVTTIHTMHGSANTIGGQNAVLKLRYGKRPRELRFDGAPRTLKFALGENVTLKNGCGDPTKRFPNTRMGVESVIRQAFIAAKAYRESKRTHGEQLASGVDLPPFREDLRLETLADVLAGDVWVHCHGYRGDEYLRLFDVAEEFGFRVAVLQHALEAYRIAPEIARHGSGVSTFSNDWAYKIEAYSGVPYNAAFLTRRGINVSINSDSPQTIRYLNIEAGKAIRWGGLSETQALALITINPAMQLGIADRVGSIEPGKDADLVLFNGHPLDSFSQCVLTLIDGEVFFQRQHARRVAPHASIQPASQKIESIPEGPHALYAITGATVHPVSGPAIENGTVLIRNDRIDEVGANVAIPPGAVIVEATGMHVYPGLIDAGSVLGISEILLARQTRDEHEIARIQPELRTLSAFHPDSAHIRVARTTGITTAVSQPTGGWISGQSDAFDLDGWTANEMWVDAFALHMNVPSLPARIPEKKRKDLEKEHTKQIEELEKFLRYAKAYNAAQNAPADKRPDRNLRLEAMGPYLRREKPVVFTANSYKHILDTIEFAEKHELRCVIYGGQEAWKCARLLSEKRIPVILDSVISYPSSDFEPFDSVFACAAELARADVEFCFASGVAAGAYNLPIQVGLAVGCGLAPDRAIRALTLDAARILGIDDRVGTLEPGKIANVIVCSDNPLQVQAGVTHMFIRGRPVDLHSMQTDNVDRFRQRPEPALSPPPILVGPPSLTKR